MNRTCLIAVAVAVAAISGGRLTGQTPQPRFKSGIDVVEVTVLARDARGGLVTDLTQADRSTRANLGGKRSPGHTVVSAPGRTRSALAAPSLTNTTIRRGGRFEERVDLAMVTVDDRGRAGNGRSTTVDLHLPPDEYQRVKATGVRWLSNLELAPGRYQFHIAGRAVGTGITGMVTHDVVVPAFGSDRVALSAITLTPLPAGVMSTRGKPWLEKTLRGPPSAARVFIAGDQITGAVEVYAPRGTKAVVLTASIERSDGSSVLTVDQSVAAESGKGETGFVIDTRELKPGGYLLRLTTGSGSNRQERTVPFEIVVRP